MKIKVGISMHHAHLSQPDIDNLFGEGYRLTPFKMLSQTGEFAANEVIDIQTDGGTLTRFRILGPARSYSQVEITNTEAHQLKIKPPVRNSGDLDGAATITLIGPKGSITKDCCIIANRHLHMSSKEAKDNNMLNGEVVEVICDTGKKTVFKDVIVKVKETYQSELHVDTDDANGNLLVQGDMVEVKKLS